LLIITKYISLIIFVISSLLFLTTKSVTNVSLGQQFRPNYARLGQNLRKLKIWKSIEVHAIYALFFILGYSTEGLQVLKTFLDSEHEEIYHPVLLAQMVLSPLNSIVDDVLLPLFQMECNCNLTRQREIKAKLSILFRFEILCPMLRILGEFGMEPKFENQQFVTKLIKSPAFGALSGTNSLVQVTGFTAAFLLTLPELFIQWRDQKNGDESNEKKYKILEFIGQQCDWPTFTNENVRRTSTHKVKHGKGSMLSNAKSNPPYSFLPNVFDLRKVFKDCLDGSTQWKTYSLCEDTKMMIESSPRKRPADTAEDTKGQESKEDSTDGSDKSTGQEPDDRGGEDEPGDGGEEDESGDGGEEDESGDGGVSNEEEKVDDDSHTEEQSGDSSGEEEEADNEKPEVKDTADEQSEASARVPRKKTKRKRSASQPEIEQNPLLGTDVTERMRSFMVCIDQSNHLFGPEHPIREQYQEFSNYLQTDNILMVFTRNSLGLPPEDPQDDDEEKHLAEETFGNCFDTSA
jgi:hypothetical protein